VIEELTLSVVVSGGPTREASYIEVVTVRTVGWGASASTGAHSRLPIRAPFQQ